MQNLKMFCICIHNELLSKVKKIDYIPVGLGNSKFDPEWIKDNYKELEPKVCKQTKRSGLSLLSSIK